MVSMDRKYWRIVGGTARKIYDDALAARSERYKQIRAFVAKHGCTQYTCYGQGEGLAGLMLPPGQELPAGWRFRERNSREMVPHKRTPEGKALIEEIRQINRIFSYEKTIQSFFTSGDGMHNEGFMLHFPSFGNIDGTSIDAVSVHQNCTVEVVDGLEPIKASEILAAMGK